MGVSLVDMSVHQQAAGGRASVQVCHQVEFGQSRAAGRNSSPARKSWIRQSGILNFLVLYFLN